MRVARAVGDEPTTLNAVGYTLDGHIENRRCVAHKIDPDWPLIHGPRYTLCGDREAHGDGPESVPLCLRHRQQVRAWAAS